MKKVILLIVLLFVFASISWADDSIKKSCSGGVNNNAALLKTTVIKNKVDKDLEETQYKTEIINQNGKCYKFALAKFQYLIDSSHAIYSMRIDGYDTASRLFLFDFGKSASKWTKISGVIKTTGEYYNYRDNKNVPRTMPKVIVIQENKI